MLVLVVPSLIGGIGGALLLRITPPKVFDALVPFLILFATLLFMAQEPIQRKLKTADGAARTSTHWLAGALVFQLFVALYGGYFGAGIGILMLAAMSIMGLSDIHQMNGLKNFLRRLRQRRSGGLLYLGADGLLAVRAHHGAGSHCGWIHRSRRGAEDRTDGGSADCDSDWIWDGGVVVCEIRGEVTAPTPLRSRLGMWHPCVTEPRP